MKLKHIQSSDGGLHTFDASLLTPNGWTLDAGCRDFTFSEELSALGQNVLALDPARDVVPREIERVKYLKHALDSSPGLRGFKVDSRGMASSMIPRQSKDRGDYAVLATTIHDLARQYEIDLFDCIKLDIEGAEYDVLCTLDRAPAKQISVEFHNKGHCLSRDDVIHHLSTWYQVSWGEYQDTLFTLCNFHSQS